MVIVKYLSKNYMPMDFTGKIITTYGTKTFYFVKNNLYHRYYGPACIVEKYKSWYFNDKKYGHSYEKYSQKQFIKDLNKLWLL